MGVFPSRAIYFWAYSTAKRNVNASLPKSNRDTPFVHVTSAAMAGTLVYRFELKITKKKTSRIREDWKIQERQECLKCSCPVILILKELFTLGFTASTLTNPIWLIKTRLQLDRSSGTKSLNIRSCITQIYSDLVSLKNFYFDLESEKKQKHFWVLKISLFSLTSIWLKVYAGQFSAFALYKSLNLMIIFAFLGHQRLLERCHGLVLGNQWNNDSFCDLRISQERIGYNAK